MKRGRPPRRVSAKRAAISEERRDLVIEVIYEFPDCQVGDVLRRFGHLQARECRRRSVDVHEVLTRARGGSILDRANVLATCRACHWWIHDNPKAATALGLLRSASGV